MNTTAQAQPYAITGTTALTTDAAANRIAAVLASDPLTPSATGGVSNIKMLFGPDELGVYRQQHLRRDREPNRAGVRQRQSGAVRPTLLFELRRCAAADLAAAGRGVLLPMPIPAMGLLGRRYHDGKYGRQQYAAD